MAGKICFIAVSMILVTTSVAMAQRAPGGGPPQEAIDACQGKQAGNACSIETPNGQLIKGSCLARGGRSFCVPAGGPDGGRAGGRPSSYEPRTPYAQAKRLTNKITETGQGTCFDDARVIDCPSEGSAFYGQDAHYRGRAPAYRDNGDGTVSDGNTGLTWQKAHNEKRQSFYDAQSACRGLGLGGHRDWRLPNLKELFSITDWRGATGRRFFLDKNVFDLKVPGAEILKGDRFANTHRVEMMGQTWSSTIYTGDHWDREGVEAAFFFNFLDGRIKQAPTGTRNKLFYRCVRGPAWGGNAFRDNSDGTVTDAASGLMWQQADDGKARNWKDSLAACESLSLAGRDDWRLPNVKELQHLVDYSRLDPALDMRYFKQKDRDGWFWSSTTHGDNTASASYVCFGKCVSVDNVDVHGAGAQRSDPKSGDPSRWGPMGGQRDQVRILNYARCVRDAG